MASADPLLTKDQLHAKLYDVESMMIIKGSVANGFIVLLQGSPPSTNSNESRKNRNNKKSNLKINENNDGDDALAFMALTSGNVLNACFGVANTTRRDNISSSRSVDEAKNLLADRDTTDSFRRTAVTAYFDAFQVIVVYHDQMNKLNFLTRCFRSGKIRRQTEVDLRTAFSPLITIIGGSSL